MTNNNSRPRSAGVWRQGFKNWKRPIRSLCCADLGSECYVEVWFNGAFAEAGHALGRGSKEGIGFRD